MVDAPSQDGRVEENGPRLGETVKIQILRRAGDGERSALRELHNGSEMPAAEDLTVYSLLVPEPGQAVGAEESETVRGVKAPQGTCVSRVIADLVAVACAYERRLRRCID